MLDGLLVDLVPYGSRFWENDSRWWNNDSRFWGSMGNRFILSKAQIERVHQEWRDSPPETGVPFGIQTKDGKPIGYIGINWISQHDRAANLGAVINEPDYWGGGYGTDALLLLLDYAFYTLDMRRVWLGTMSLNARVMRQMEKVGFMLEARRREATVADGVWYDELIYGMMAEEWPGRETMIVKLGLSAAKDR
ncbi:MAG TPA: GNAT family protein [Aggregatilineaceae bacterium]|nr:GNAT family protein [Aggregatilineaceae bacterium]